MEELILQYIEPKLFIMVVFLYAIGLFLKLYKAFTEEWMIPTILLIISVVFTILVMAIMLGEGFTPMVLLTGTIQGVLISAVTVFSNELAKQFMVKRKGDRS